MQTSSMPVGPSPVTDSDPQSNADKRRQSAWRSPWVIAWLGLVVVVLGVNITMVVLAIVTNPGLVRSDYYEGGREVERNIQSRLASQPGWTVRFETPEDLRTDSPAKIRFAAVDKTGQPVRPDAVTYRVYRPSDAARDFSKPMTRIGPGLFEVEASFPLPGVWDTMVTVAQGDDEESFVQRIHVEMP